ncbi:glutamic acid-rich protein-like, partial [Cydia amplana]|uniref:glutamic acid-rich protein-like n=1 Tax=Cydia amplana TaxID=1869771 RepID=UPI002FE5DA8F
MEVEVRLTRTGEEPWGFRLIGGTDFNMPLTVVKVLPDSSADLAGIRNGDTVASIQGEKAATMTHDGAKAAVAAAGDSLSLGVMRGLYDLTLDDYDPIDDPLDQDDFDQPSHPTEVFQIQQFGDTPLDSKDPSRSRTGSRGNLDRRSLSEGRCDPYDQRSLTESPYFLNTKPYRPFSTEPSPIPPLEKPIILNPNYHDEFGTFDDGLDPPVDLPNVDEFAGILSEKSRYKLPISKQYDPDGTKIKKTKEITTVTKTVEEKIVTEEIVTKELKITSVEERLVKEQKEEAKFMEKTKIDIDMGKIEMTATSIVDESIEKAVTVADEIKKEIDLELSAITSESKTSSSDMETVVMTSARKESTKEVSEMSETVKKTNDVVVKKSDVSVAKEIAKFEKDDKQIIVDERQEFRKQELEETIESGSVRRKSEMYDRDVKMADTKVEKISVDETIESGSVRRKSEMFDNDVKKIDSKVEKKFADESIESGSVRRKSEMYDKNVEVKSVDDTKTERKQSKIIYDQKDIKAAQSAQQKQTSEIKTEKISTTTESVLKSEESKTKDAKYSTAKLLAEQRAYTIGLQTIPHIRGTVQSNYHYDLLLKTFFIHLTDVMVALSRFILAEPVLSKPLETKSEVKKEVTEVTRVERGIVSDTTTVKDSVIDRKKTERLETEDFQIREKKDKVEKVADVIKQDHVREVKQHEYTDYVEKIQQESEKREKNILSGAEMAQLSDKKSGELITKMDGVITEFQTKAGLEEEITMQRERRSRSRSKVDEEVVKDALSRVDKTSQEITEVRTTSSVLESREIKTETKHESMDIKRETKHEASGVSSKDGKSTYISICEAHVYTNKNSILDETAEISETTSVESIKETNIALEANEAMVTESVAIESQSQIKQEAEAVVESHEISSAKTEDVIVQEKKNIIQETDVQKSSIQIESNKAAVIEKVETIQPIVELHEDIVEKAISVEIKNKMNIQEIETTEYIDELNVVKEESIEITESHDINEVQVLEDISVKAKEESIKIEEIKEEIVQDVKESISLIEEDVKVSKEEIVSVKEEAIAVQEVKESVSITKEDIKKLQVFSIKEEVAEV